MNEGLNNFIYKLPGGFLRDNEYRNICTEAGKQREKLFTLIDGILIASRVDLDCVYTQIQQFQELQNKWNQRFRKWARCPLGKPPSDRVMLQRRKSIEGRYRFVYKILLEYTEYDHDELIL